MRTLINIARAIPGFLVVAVSLISSYGLRGQEWPEVPKFSLRAGYAQGGIWEHRPELALLKNTSVTGFFADLGWQADTGVDWAWQRHYPQLGVSLWYNHYPSEALGYSLAIIPYVENHWPRHSSRWSVLYRVGLGLGFQSRIFHAQNNPDNRAITAHGNIAFDLRTGLEWAPLPRWRIAAGVGLLHYSNGATRLPNYGINIPQLWAGLRWQTSRQAVVPARLPPRHESEQQWVALLSGGMRAQRHSDRWLPVQALSLEYNFSPRGRNWFSLGWSQMNQSLGREYDIWAQIWGDGSHQVPGFWELLTGGPYLGCEMRLGRLSAFLHAGWYAINGQREFTATIDYGEGPFVHRMVRPDSWMYNRLGFRYRSEQQWLLQLHLYTHTFTAQYIELGWGTYF